MAECHPVFSIGWKIEINDMLSRPKQDTILRVATHLLKTKPEAYIPQFLSIGPYHHANLAYIPQFLSIGPYHHAKLDKDIRSKLAGEQSSLIGRRRSKVSVDFAPSPSDGGRIAQEIHDECAGGKISRAEMHKAKVAAILHDELLQHHKSFKSIVEMMEAMRREINQFYDWRGVYEVQSQNTERDQMMAIDSSFLLLFLIELYVSREQQETAPVDDRHPSRWRPSPSLHDDMIKLSPLEVLCIKSDILKLENQIPLTLLERVFECAEEALKYRGLPEDLNQLLHKTCAVLSSFKFEVSDDEYIKGNEATVENMRSPHLLAYIHALVSPILQMKPEDQDADLCTHIKFHILKWNSPSVEGKHDIAPSAEKFAKNGIKFTGRDKMIRFDSWSGTLYLPWINVTEMQTEVLLRNMLAWEVNHKSRGNSVTDYVGLMQCLIQTPQDVRVLKDSRVIESTLTDESIARMWKYLAGPSFSTDNLGPHYDDLGRRLYFVLHKTFHVIKIRRITFKIRRITRKLGDLYDYLYDCVTNWKFIGFVAGFLGLALTATQAYFTVFPRNL